MDAAVAAFSESKAATQLGDFVRPDALGYPGGLVEPGQAPQVVPVVGLVRVTDVLGAPTAQHDAVWAAVVPDPARAFQDVRPVDLGPE